MKNAGVDSSATLKTAGLQGSLAKGAPRRDSSDGSFLEQRMATIADISDFCCGRSHALGVVGFGALLAGGAQLCREIVLRFLGLLALIHGPSLGER